MNYMMQQEQSEYIKRIEEHMLKATNMTQNEAYDFAFRCWQMGYDKVTNFISKDKIRKLLEEKEKLSNDLYYSPNYDEKASIEVDKIDSQIDLLKQLLEEE